MRVQFDMADEAVAYLDDIKEKTGATSRAEVLRNSIAALQWLVEKAEDGFTIVAAKEGEKVAKELSMPILQDAARHAKKVTAAR